MSLETPKRSLTELVEEFFEQRLTSLPGFELRPSQKTMALAVAEALESGQMLAVEAETGVGKSLAYLVPLLLRESADSQPAVIATKTLQLQHQLLRKDLPMLQSLLESPRTVVQAKGWNNYLCLRKLDTPGERARLELGDHLPRLRQQVVSKPSELSRQDLYLPANLWPHLQADPLDCQKRDCPAFSRCTLFSERRAMDSADIIITNHAFLLTDLRLRREGNALLPCADALVVDEAHRLDDVATDHLAVRLDPDRVFSTIDSPLQSATRGWLATARFSFLAHLPDEMAIEWARRFDRVVVMGLKNLSLLAANLFAELSSLRASHPTARTLPHSLLSTAQGEQTANLGSELGFVLEEMVGELRQMVFDYELDCPSAAPQEISRLGKSLQTLADDLDFLLAGESPEWVYLCGLEPPLLIARPVDNSQALGQELFHRTRSIVLTSASLRVRNNFHFFFHRTGLDPNTTVQLALASPFQYETSTYIGINNSGPEPGSDDYPRHLSGSLLKLLVGLQGRTFLLTTSHRRVEVYSQLLRAPLREAGIELLVQGEAAPGQLLQRFRSERPSVLLGVDTFWEGVDVVGERLSCVVMTRLPFPVPTDPLFQARSDLVSLHGGLPFEDLSLPLVALKLRQGFGRLLRSETDRGIFLLLDPRVQNKRYGRTLLRHIPAGHAHSMPVEALVEGALQWAEENIFQERRLGSVEYENNL